MVTGSQPNCTSSGHLSWNHKKIVLEKKHAGTAPSKEVVFWMNLVPEQHQHQHQKSTISNAQLALFWCK